MTMFLQYIKRSCIVLLIIGGGIICLWWMFGWKTYTDVLGGNRTTVCRFLGRITKVKLDENNDGYVDNIGYWHWHNPCDPISGPFAVKEEVDINFDRRMDTWLSHTTDKDGKPASDVWSIDTNNDGRADISFSVSSVGKGGIRQVDSWAVSNRGFGVIRKEP